jgi:hypothetical protein
VIPQLFYLLYIQIVGMVSYKKRKETSIEGYKTMVSLLHDLLCDPNYYGVSIDQSIVEQLDCWTRCHRSGRYLIET